MRDIIHLYGTKKYYENDNKDNIDYKGLRDIRTLFESEEGCYEPLRIGSAFDNNYIEYESNGDKDKTLSIMNIFIELEQYDNLSDMINDHKTQGEWKIQLTMAVNFMSSKDSNETMEL